MVTDCILDNLDENNPTYIREYEFWTVLANFKQPTLGANLIVLNRHTPKLSAMTEDENYEYLHVVTAVENALDQAFQPNMVNHLMLANTVNHVHYHVVPRYQQEKVFAGNRWIDENYGTIPKLKVSEKPQEIITAVIEELQKYL